MTHGYAPGVQMRAAMWLLALANERRLILRRTSQGGAWPLLLRLHQKTALCSLSLEPGEQPSPGEQIVYSHANPLQLMLTDWHHLHAGIGPEAWLGLIDGIDGEAQGMALPRGGKKVWQMGLGSRATLLAGPPSTGPWRVPWPVDGAFLDRPDSLGEGLLVIAGDGPPHEALARIAGLAVPSGRPLFVFDAYGLLSRPGLRAQLPPGTQVLGPAPAPARRAFFAACHSYLLDGAPAAMAAVDPWQLEASALGLVAEGRGAPAVAADAIMEAGALVRAMLPALEHPGARRLRHGVQGGSKTLEVCTELAADDGAHAPRALFILGPLPAETAWPSLAQTIAACGFASIFCQVGPHTAFLGPLMMAHLRRLAQAAPDYQHRQTQEALWQAALGWLDGAPPGAHLQVLVPSADALLVDGGLAQQARWLARAGAAPPSLPVIAINTVSDYRRAGASATQVGASVASDDLSWGAYLASPQTFTPKWLRHGGQRLNTSSLFLHPLTRPALASEAAAEAELWSAATLRLALLHNKVDAVFMPGGPLGASLHAMRCAYAKRPVAMVSALHGLHTPEFQYYVAGFMLNGPVYPFDGFIVPSQCGRTALLHMWETLRQWLLAQGHRQVPGAVDVAVIPYGIDTAFYAPRNPLSCRLNLGVPPEAITILCFGRISRRFKACLLPLLLALQILKRQQVHAHLIIAGSSQGPQEIDRLKKAITALDLGDRVSFYVSLSLEDKGQLLSAADIFVAMSDTCQETHGLAPIEAMAAGLPVVAAAWNGFRELVVHDETGYLVNTAWTAIPEGLFLDNAVDKQDRSLGFDDLHETVAMDVQELASALGHLVAHGEVRARFGAAGRARARSHFDARKQGERIVEHLLHKVDGARAQDATFVPAEPHMLVDRVDQRFAHYPTAILDGSTPVAAGPWADDASYRAMVAQYIGAADPEEAEIIDEIAQRIGRGPTTLAALLSPRVDMLRLMRCLKYNILRLDSRPH
jgi:glycosyltransferase involved in cell wall biosynthesis